MRLCRFSVYDFLNFKAYLGYFLQVECVISVSVLGLSFVLWGIVLVSIASSSCLRQIGYSWVNLVNLG